VIELVSAERCTACNICVRACPTQVFDAVPGGIPVIARQDDCQTCFMCELYCPEDALFVAPQADTAEAVDEATLRQRGLLGSYRAAIGWGRDRQPTAALDHSHHLLARAR
jgi:NAD-dependent dihydropyrimidine dehydrogenase PreA subunit